MTPSPLFAVLLLASMPPLLAGPLDNSYRLNDHGRAGEFEVARDEIHQHGATLRTASRASVDGIRSAARDSGADLVLYVKGKPHTEENRRLLTRRVAVHLAAGENAAALATETGAENAAAAPHGAGWYIFQSGPEPGSALELAAKLRGHPGVIAVEPLLARQQKKRFVPNDTFFGNQWHLRNTGQLGGPAGIDVNITGAWDTYQGTGVTIGIVDDGLEHTHPDLAANYSAANSFDFNFNTPDPQPAPFEGDDHGTACAGLAAACGNNGIGVAGAAFKAKLAGLRLIALPSTDEEEAQAFAFKNDVIAVKSNSWGPIDDGKTLDGPGPLATAALEDAVQNGRGGLGTVFVWAGGNGGLVGDVATFDGYAGSRTVIAVGALTNNGIKAPYSEPGTNLLCVAPSSGGKKDLRIATVDRAGTDGYNFSEPGELSDPYYTKEFGGTSAAAPIVSGCVALMLQANPNLGWRDVQEILITTAKKVDVGSDAGLKEGWITNSAGFHFNDKYGAGLIDATAAVNLATTWTNLGPELVLAQEASNLAKPIPNNKAAGTSYSFTFSDPNFRIEHALLTVDIQHAMRGQLQVTLTSPTNVVSKLAPVRSRDRNANFDHWTFMSTHHWGDFATGTWTINVSDHAGGAAGLINSLKLEFFGSAPGVHADADSIALVTDPNSNGGVDPNEHVTVDFGIRNDGVHTATNVTATLQADADVTNPSGVQVYGAISPGASAARPFDFTVAAADLPGKTIHPTLNLTYLDGVTPVTRSITYAITLGKIETATFTNITATNTDAIAIPSFASFSGAGNADPYPSTIDVSGLPQNAVITSVVIHLNYFRHSKTNAIAMLLVGPTGKAMVPMSDAGAGGAQQISLTLSDDAAVPLSSAIPLASGTYLPTNHAAATHAFPAPPQASAPPKPSGSGFSVFNGTNPNAQWKLYIRDIKARGFGGIGNWSLDITYAH